jgi:hypothetical protein
LHARVTQGQDNEAGFKLQMHGITMKEEALWRRTLSTGLSWCNGGLLRMSSEGAQNTKSDKRGESLLGTTAGQTLKS